MKINEKRPGMAHFLKKKESYEMYYAAAVKKRYNLVLEDRKIAKVVQKQN